MTNAWLAWPVGERVVVRRRLPDGYYSDLLGLLLESTAEGVRVRGRSGDVWVPGEEIAVGKVVPPPPPRRRSRRTQED